MAAETSVIKGQDADASDSDRDKLPDAWEQLHFGDLAGKPGDDADSDTLDNLFEFEIGTNPLLADSDKDGNADWVGIRGFLLQEKWWQKSDWPRGACDVRYEYNRPGASQFFNAGTSVSSLGGKFSHERLRGRIVAPVNGDYEFWIAGDNWCELWLGIDVSPFGARKLAGLLSDKSSTKISEWDKFPSQKSPKVNLVAGQEYYIEILHRGFRKRDEVGIAWKVPGEVRKPLPPNALLSFVPNPEDTDDDGMRDKWEDAHGLVVGKHDAMEDPDGDGVVNILEHEAGSDPQLAGAVPGMLSWSRWFMNENPDVKDFLNSASFARPPDHFGAIPGFKEPCGADRWAFGRKYGTVTAPESGLYSFWLVGKATAELSLSSDSHSFNKLPIARNLGAVSNIVWLGDKHTVRSVPVFLKKGESRFIEAIFAQEVGWTQHESRKWNEADLGGGSSGTWQERDETMTATVRGAAAFGAVAGESMSFRYAEVDGISEAICRVDPVSSFANGAGGGLMFRESTDPFAPFAAVTLDSRRKITFHSRPKAGQPVRSDVGVRSLSGTLQLQDALWLRLRADGKECLAFWSVNGVNWFEAGKIQLKFGKKMIAGPVAWGGNKQAVAEVRFSNLVISGLFPVEDIPSNVLATNGPDPEDIDSDSLPDAWERLHDLDFNSGLGQNGPSGDPDRDKLLNVEEYKMGGDPLKHGGIPGYLTFERWNDVPGSRVADLLENHKFKGPPSVKQLISKPDLEGGNDSSYGQRIRGTLVAPESGTYQFWISGDNGCSLALSDSSDRYGRRVIASLAGVGRASTNMHEWDKFPSQASKGIQLVAGNEYYIEILHKEGQGGDHVSVAWAYLTPEGKSQAREILPARALKSFVPDIRDLDEDDLPDNWERRMGLNPNDNGFSDTKREGRDGDYDSDRLTNHEEYRLGSHPLIADTDGDGVDDRDEIDLFNSDPLKKDASPPVVVTKIPLHSVISGGPRWLTSPEDGFIHSIARRGESTWEFEVEKSGVYLVAISGFSESARLPAPSVPISLGVDGIDIGTGVLNAGPTLTRIAHITRWLPAGNHKISVFNHNVRSGVSMAVASLEILAMTGVDTDADGCPDWLESSYKKLDNIQPPFKSIVTSPACLEGMARHFEDLSLETTHGEKVAASRGLTGRWYADIPLDPNGEATSLKISFEGDAITENVDLVWAETNLLAESGEYLIRLGDSMRLTAYDPKGERKGTDFHVSLKGEDLYRGAADRSYIHKFETEGRHKMLVESTSENGVRLVKTVVFVVCKADLGAGFSVPSDRSRKWIPQDLSPVAQIVCDQNLSLVENEAATGASRSFEASFGVKVGTSGRVIARIPEGPILSTTTIAGFYLAPATVTGDHQLIEILADGTRVVLVSYVIDGKIPPDLSIWIQLYVPDAVFANGDTWLHLTAKDFDENGRTQFKVFKAPGTGIPYVCHWIRPYGEGPPGRHEEGTAEPTTGREQ